MCEGISGACQVSLHLMPLCCPVRINSAMAKHTPESYRNFVSQNRPDLVVVADYINVLTAIEHRCNGCGKPWITQPRTVIRGGRCQNCFFKSVRDTADQYQAKLDQMGTGLKLLGPYLGSRTPTLHQHICCGETRITKPDTALTPRKMLKCPSCQPRIPPSYWSKKTEFNSIIFDSHLECNCYKILLLYFAKGDIALQKRYLPDRRLTADFYIKSIDLYIEVSSIRKKWYFERIYKKRQIVNNFFFASTVEQLRDFLCEIIGDSNTFSC